IVTCPKRVGMFRTENLFPDSEDAAMLSFGLGRLAAVIESDGKPVAGQQRIRVHRAEELLLSSNDSAETFDSVVILSLAILCVGEADAALPGVDGHRPARGR